MIGTLVDLDDLVNDGNDDDDNDKVKKKRYTADEE